VPTTTATRIGSPVPFTPSAMGSAPARAPDGRHRVARRHRARGGIPIPVEAFGPPTDPIGNLGFDMQLFAQRVAGGSTTVRQVNYTATFTPTPFEPFGT